MFPLTWSHFPWQESIHFDRNSFSWEIAPLKRYNFLQQDIISFACIYHEIGVTHAKYFAWGPRISWEPGSQVPREYPTLNGGKWRVKPAQIQEKGPPSAPAEFLQWGQFQVTNPHGQGSPRTFLFTLTFVHKALKSKEPSYRAIAAWESRSRRCLVRSWLRCLSQTSGGCCTWRSCWIRGGRWLI